MDNRIVDMMQKLAQPLQPTPNGDNITYILYETEMAGVADELLHVRVPLHIMLAKRNDIGEGPMHPGYITGDLDLRELPSNVRYLGKSDFQSAKSMFGDKNG